jgi:CBS domain containing-hemolysin-like protein
LTFFDVFAWFVLLLLVATAVGIFVFAGLWPGKVARARNHPAADAIAIGSWLTLLLGFVFWPVVAIWAHMTPATTSSSEADPTTPPDASLDALEKRVADLEARSAAGGSS